MRALNGNWFIDIQLSDEGYRHLNIHSAAAMFRRKTGSGMKKPGLAGSLEGEKR